MPTTPREDVVSALLSPMVLVGVVCVILFFILTHKQWGNTTKANLYFLRGTTAIVLIAFTLALGIPLGFYHAADLSIATLLCGIN